jgi:hypothetical protein
MAAWCYNWVKQEVGACCALEVLLDHAFEKAATPTAGHVPDRARAILFHSQKPWCEQDCSLAVYEKC